LRVVTRPETEHDGTEAAASAQRAAAGGAGDLSGGTSGADYYRISRSPAISKSELLYSGFAGTEFGSPTAGARIDTLVLVGFTTDAASIARRETPSIEFQRFVVA